MTLLLTLYLGLDSLERRGLRLTKSLRSAAVPNEHTLTMFTSTLIQNWFSAFAHKSWAAWVAACRA